MNAQGRIGWLASADKILSAIAILAAPTYLPGGTVSSVPDNGPTQTRAQLNSASLTSMERSYLKVPAACKARSAAFDPVRVEREAIPAKILTIHSALGANSGALG